MFGLGARGDVVGGLGLVVVVGDDGAHQCGGLSAGASAHDVHTGWVGVLVVVFAGHPLIQLGGVGFAAAGHRHVQRGAAGVFAEDGVHGVGGGALAGVRRGRVSVGDVLAQVVPGKQCPRSVGEASGRDPLLVVVDGEHGPPVAVADGVGGLALGGVDADGGVVFAGDDDVTGGDPMFAGRRDGRRVGGDGVVVDAPVEGVAQFPGVGD